MNNSACDSAALNVDDNDPNQDLVDAGFHRLDPELIVERPPKIQWGVLYRNSDADARLAYLEKLAAAMNHAAYLIQGERNQLGELCEKKEEQLVAMKVALDQNNTVLQQQITSMNEERQKYNAAIAKLNAKLRAFKNGDNR